MRRGHHSLSLSISLVLIGLLCARASATDIALRFIPELTIPVGSDASSYTMGGGGTLIADLDLFGFFAPYLEAGVNYSPIKSVGSGLVLADGGGGLSVYSYPGTRLMARIGAGGGMSAVSWSGTSGTALYWRTRGELGYRFSPTFTLLADAGYVSHLGTGEPIMSGVTVGLVANVSLGILSDKSGGLEVEERESQSVYPITFNQYEKRAIGKVVLTNVEQAEIRDVKVSFGAGAYTSRDVVCGSFTVIGKGKSVEVPIYGAFNEHTLGFSETTKVQGQVKVSYKLLDSPRDVSKGVSVEFENRNAVRWSDARIVAAFVSPNDPTMLEFSKYIAGLVRTGIRSELDKNLQFGMGMFEALRLYGVVWAADPNTPYKAYHGDVSKDDYIQYPYQTLMYKSGDSDEIALTMAEALESVAVAAAVIPLKDEMLVAFPLEMSEGAARTSFVSPGDFIYVGGKAWVPVRVSLIREGFLRAWQEGARLWREAAAGGSAPQFIAIEDGWKAYQAVSLPDVNYSPERLPEEQVNLALSGALDRFVAREVAPKAARLISEMQGEGTGRQRNNLGILYAQYGLLSRARGEFEKAVAKGYDSALVNLANVAFLLKDYETAAKDFEAALKAQPGNKAALLGLARARYELDAYAEADDLFAEVKSLDAGLAARDGYLESPEGKGSGVRASGGVAGDGGMDWVAGP